MPNNPTITEPFSGGVRFWQRTRDSKTAPGAWSLTKPARNANDELVRAIDCPSRCSGDAMHATLAANLDGDFQVDPNDTDVVPAEYLAVLGPGVEAERSTLCPTPNGHSICWAYSAVLGLLRGQMELAQISAPISRGFQNYLLRLNWDLRFVATSATEGSRTGLISLVTVVPAGDEPWLALAHSGLQRVFAVLEPQLGWWKATRPSLEQILAQAGLYDSGRS
jgi:hypothetical protein